MTTAPLRAHSPLVGIAGWKNSGKTTLVERLVAHFALQGLDVATIKHAHHAFKIDDDATDSGRHRRAGARQVAVASQRRWAIIRELGKATEPSLTDIIEELDRCDLIIIEGYKSAPIPKIEVRRQAAVDKRSLSESDPFVVAIAADYPVLDANRPTFELDDISAIARFVLSRASER